MFGEWSRSGGLVGVAVGLVCALALTAYGVTEEVEVATLSGVATLADTKAPAKNAEVHLEAFREGADLAGLVTIRTETDDAGRFVLRNVPVGYSTIRVYAPGYSAETAIDARTDSQEIRLHLTWAGDQLEASTNQPVFTPDEHPTLVLSGQTRRNNVKLSIFTFTDEEIFARRDASTLTRAIAYNRQWERAPAGEEPKPIQTFEHKFASQDKEGKFGEVVELPVLKEGIYVVRAEVDQAMVHRWINVSRIGLITKVSPNGLTGFVVDVTSGDPISGASVFTVGPGGRQNLGLTGEDGLVVSNRPGENGSYVMVASHDGSRAMSMYDRWQDSDGEVSTVHLQTDRPIYRPEDEVMFKGFVRVPEADGYRLPGYSSVQVRVLDPDGTELKSESRPLSAMGGFDGSFTALPEITGSYQIETVIDGQTHVEWVPVAAYRKPEFRITVTPVKDFYLIGQNAQFKVKAEFFTGEPVVGAELSAWAYRLETWDWSAFDDQEFDWWNYEDSEYSYGGEMVGDYKARTDENGEAVITVPTSSGASSTDYGWSRPNDYVYTLSVTGEDVSGRGFTAEGKVDVARGEVDLSVAFEDYVVAPNSPVRVRVRALTYGSEQPAAGKRVEIAFGEQTWDGRKSTDRRRGSQSVTLDDRGEAVVTVRPANEGDFFVEATMTDSGNRRIASRDYVWVYSYGGQVTGPVPTFQLVLDKKTYEVGDIATAVVRTDKPGGSAIITVEADDVLWTRVVELEEQATTVQIPVTRATRPNATINACYIREKRFARSSRSLIVDLGADTLQVLVEPDKNETLPGTQVAYRVTTRDAEGNPVSADVSFAVVDEGVFSIREDRTDPLRSFFPHRWSAVSTYYSFPEVYLDGEDKDPVNADVRRDFRDTAYWAPSVVTGDDGTAVVEVALPDNLTSWRATAVAVSSDAKCGKGRSDVVARKPLMVRVSPPAFMVQDERQTIGATVANETDQRQRVEVRIFADGLKVDGPPTRQIDLEAHTTGRAAWNVQATKAGEARIRVTASTVRGGHTDGLERTFPIHTNGPTEVAFNSGDTDSVATYQVEVRENAQQAELEIELSPTLLSSIVGSLDSLVDYPYGCVEQTMSRFMPAVVVQHFLRESGIQRPDLEKKIADVSVKSQARLRTMQSSSGGFGWFAYDDGDPNMTALVLEGLYWAQRAGVDVNPHMRDRAIEWSKQYASSGATVSNSANARLGYALALHGVAPSSWSRLLPKVEVMGKDSLGLSYIVLAIDAAKSPVTGNDATVRASAYKALIALGTETATTMNWADDWSYEPTAVAMLAVSKSDSAKTDKVLRYLVTNRRGDSWTSTRDTAQIIVAAIEHLRNTNELRPDLSVKVEVNGTASQTYSFGTQDLDKSHVLRIPLQQLEKGRNSVRMSVQGTGRLYYSSTLTQTLYDPRPRAKNSGHGLQIKREYFRMEARRLEDGTLRLVPSRSSVTSARQGEVLRCRITITSDEPRRYVMVTDPALSNARAIDPGQLQEWDWYYWWSDQSFLDDHTAIFMSYLGTGESIVEYSVRAEAIGEGIALPATVSMMYAPDVRASTGTARLEVRQ